MHKRSTQPKPKRQIRSTERQKKLIKLILENFGKPGSTKSMYQMMLDAGYSETSAHAQGEVLAGIRDKVDPIVQRLIDHREKIITAMGKKLPKANYRALVEGLDKVTKVAQLLAGKPTDRPNHLITGLENMTDEQLDEFLKSRKAGAGEGTH